MLMNQKSISQASSKSSRRKSSLIPWIPLQERLKVALAQDLMCLSKHLQISVSSPIGRSRHADEVSAADSVNDTQIMLQKHNSCWRIKLNQYLESSKAFILQSALISESVKHVLSGSGSSRRVERFLRLLSRMLGAPGYMLGVPAQEAALILCHLLLLLPAGNTNMTQHW